MGMGTSHSGKILLIMGPVNSRDLFICFLIVFFY